MTQLHTEASTLSSPFEMSSLGTISATFQHKILLMKGQLANFETFLLHLMQSPAFIKGTETFSKVRLIIRWRVEQGGGRTHKRGQLGKLSSQLMPVGSHSNRKTTNNSRECKYRQKWSIVHWITVNACLIPYKASFHDRRVIFGGQVQICCRMTNDIWTFPRGLIQNFLWKSR